MALLEMFTVEEELERNSELKQSDLTMLRDWHKKQPHLPPMSDYELVLFLHSNYYRTEPTKTTIDTFFTIKTHVPEFFSDRDPLGSKSIREIMKVSCCVLLPGTTPEGYRVVYSRLIDYDPSHYVPIDAMKLVIMSMDLWLRTVGPNPGYIIIVDMEGSVFSHMARLSPMTAKKYLYYLQEALPIRLKAIHCMNTAPFIDVLLNLFKPFMNKGFMDLISLHSTKETLAKKIPINLLANDQGGEAGPLKDLWEAEVRNLEEHRAWFQEDEMRKVNETVRPGKAKNATDFFGVEGSFKKLDID